MASGGSSAGGGIGGLGGQQQIINGVSYTMFSPAWYDAMHAEAQRKTVAAGTAQGSALAAASAAAGVPIGSSSSSSGSTSSGSTGSGSSGSGSVAPPTIPSPSLSGLSSAAGGTVAAPTAATGTSSAAYSHLAPVDTSAAEKASFNTAKDQVGQEATGSLTGLRAALGSRGLLGGGQEGVGTASVVNNAAGQLGAVSRQQAITRADEAQKNAATNFQGDITQRGQDFQKEEAANSLAGDLAATGYQGQITQRGQDIQAANAAKALELEQAQLSSQQRSTALAGLEAALKVTAPAGMMY